jgi:hypothetical protein
MKNEKENGEWDIGSEGMKEGRRGAGKLFLFILRAIKTDLACCLRHSLFLQVSAHQAGLPD